MPIVITERFAKAYAKLPRHVWAKVDKALRLLDEDFRHPGLRARAVEGTQGIYEARVDRKHRLTYERDGDRLIMRNVGKHDKTLDRA
jgi:mRNA-degrading endonuclease RelE of RelBE toxin-antitoxin system